MRPAMIQLAMFAGFFAALALLVAASAWWRVVKAAGDPPAIDATRARSAAFATVMAFGLLGVALLAVVLDRIG